MLRLRKRCDHFGGYYTEVTEDEPQDIASVVYGIVAATLAEPLRRAFRAHLDEHGCGFLSCPEAAELWDLLPDCERIAFGYA